MPSDVIRRVGTGLPKGRAIKDLAIGYAVERASTGHHEVIDRNSVVQSIQQMKEDFFEAMLQSEGEVHISLRDFCMRFARLTEQFFHAV